MSEVRGGAGSGGRDLPSRNRSGAATEIGLSPAGTTAASGSGATTGAAQALAQAIAFMPLSGWSGQSGQSPWPDMTMSDIIAILAAMPLAWATDRLIPAATKTARNEVTSCRTDQSFIKKELRRTAPKTSRVSLCPHSGARRGDGRLRLELLLSSVHFPKDGRRAWNMYKRGLKSIGGQC